MIRPGGPHGPVLADVRGQDVRTDEDGRGRVVSRVAAMVEVDQRTGEVVTVREVAASRPPGSPGEPGGADGPDGPGEPGGPGGFDALVGVGLRSGFGRRLDATFPEGAARRSLAYSLLSDLGGAFLVGGYALLREGAIPTTPDQGEVRARAQADICIGWATGSPLLESLRRDGRSAIPYGPEAPVLEGDDPLGWHPMAPMATGTVRRRRRLDVAPGASGGEALAAHSHFRDSYRGDDGETVMHEYVVRAGVDHDGRLARVEVEPRTLPWRECPGAAASAQRLVGVAVGDIPARARRDLVGPSTCTHLTSTLRSLADLEALAPQLA